MTASPLDFSTRILEDVLREFSMEITYGRGKLERTPGFYDLNSSELREQPLPLAS